MVNGAPCPRGEVCFKGSNVFLGYYLDPEKTAEAIDADGWLHSGDIGMWLPDQSLKLIDRKKNIFKTAQGEYIAPEKIENVYQRCKLVAQSFVHGDSLEAHLVGVIVPDEEELVAWAKSKKVAFKAFPDLVSNPLVRQAILEEMASIGKEAGLKGFEVVKAIHLTPVPFSVENELVRQTCGRKDDAERERALGAPRRSCGFVLTLGACVCCFCWWLSVDAHIQAEAQRGRQILREGDCGHVWKGGRGCAAGHDSEQAVKRPPRAPSPDCTFPPSSAACACAAGSPPLLPLRISPSFCEGRTGDTGQKALNAAHALCVLPSRLMAGSSSDKIRPLMAHPFDLTSRARARYRCRREREHLSKQFCIAAF